MQSQAQAQHQHQQHPSQFQHQHQQQHAPPPGGAPAPSFLFGDNGGPGNLPGGTTGYAQHMVGTGATPGVGASGVNGGEFFFDPSCLEEIQPGKYGSWY